jgi:phthalate 4,5-dioxygenase reductase subunit
MVDHCAEGDLVPASSPRNVFELVEAERYLLIAGGIGITPLRAMFHDLLARGHHDVHLVYLTRSREETPYRDELTDPVLPGRVTLHHSAQAGRFDLWPLLAEPDDDTRIYCCGSGPLMDSVHALTMHWRPSRIHVERFTGADALAGPTKPFTAVWSPTGRTVPVPADRSLLNALRAAGITVESSCESGTCGTCRLRLLGGEPDHRDLVLSPQERADTVISCVSRTRSDELVLAPWPTSSMRPPSAP